MPVNLDREQLTEDFRQTIDATKDSPVFINDHGRPAFVVLTIEQYYQRNAQPSIADMLAQKEGEYFEYDFPKLEGPLLKPFEFD